ncbi:ABC transporter [Colletotrichum orchidophilum]|uniref:ABC transporter n=1 Tax=Colletotrichum orchidophilum TaxID=1209926 RepID=A0A1G4BTS5_9PEZI|nr:ABC transporter [Colletotrichum orchidophilum]OHF04657.1 ABC transporter [Colletotrichum orchidophilum]
MTIGVVSAFFCAALRTILAVVLGQLFQIMMDFGSGISSVSYAMTSTSQWCVVICILAAGALVGNSMLLLSWFISGELQARSARESVFNGLLAREMGWYDKQADGIPALLIRMETQTCEVQIATSQVLGFIVADSVSSAACLTLAFSLSWKLTLVLIASLPFAIAALSFANRRLQPAIVNQKQHLTDGCKRVQACIAAIDLVKIYNGFNQEVMGYGETLDAAMEQYLVQARGNALQISFMSVWVSIIFVGGFWIGLWLVTKGERSSAVLTTFYATLTALEGVSNLMFRWLVSNKGIAAGEALSQMTKEPLSMEKASLDFPAEETRFIVGRSGSGKSTLGNLLVNFYEPLLGDIFTDNLPIKIMEKEWLWRNITLAQQDSAVFDNTLLWNITLGHPFAANEVRTACDMSLLQSPISSLPSGLKTWVGTIGHRLSGGQRQKLALARARLRDPPILIVDEIKSGLDGETKAMAMDAIQAWRKTKTTIIITHDLSHIKQDDYVYVLNGGCVVQEGRLEDISRDPHGVFAHIAADEIREVNDPNQSLPPDRVNVHPLVPELGNLQPSLQFTRHRCGDLLGSNENIKPTKSHIWDNMVSVQAAGYNAKAARKSGQLLRQKHILTTNDGLELEQENVAQVWPLETNFEHISAILHTVWPNLAPTPKLRLVVGLILCLIASGCTPVFAFCFAQLLASFWATEDRLSIGQEWVICLLMVAILNGLSGFLGRYLMEHASQAWVISLRLKAMRRMLEEPKTWFKKLEDPASHIGECLDKKAEEMRTLVSRFVPLVVMIVAMAIILTTWALNTSWKLTLVALSSLPAIMASLKVLSVAGRKWETLCNRGAATTASVIHEALGKIRATKAFTQEKYFSQRHAELTASTYRLGLERGLYLGPLFRFNESISYFVVALVGWYGIHLTAKRLEMTATSCQQVANLPLFCVVQTAGMLGMMPQVSASQAAASQVLMLATPSTITLLKPENSERLTSIFPIKARKVSFAYPSRPAHRVLRDIELDIDRGQYVAIVGPSGCGKSTILSLLVGLYWPSLQGSAPRNNSAQLTYGGIAYDQIQRDDLCSLVSFVPQSPFLFPTTIRENITYGQTETSQLLDDSNVRRAAREAGIHDFISSLPRGYNTIVGDGGLTLSGGQSQRVCIARALARRPRLLISDEATSALDNLSAETIRQTLCGILESTENSGASVVVATHDRDMIHFAHRIVVVEDGRVVNEEIFQELQHRKTPLSKIAEQGQ